MLIAPALHPRGSRREPARPPVSRNDKCSRVKWTRRIQGGFRGTRITWRDAAATRVGGAIFPLAPSRTLARFFIIPSICAFLFQGKERFRRALLCGGGEKSWSSPAPRETPWRREASSLAQLIVFGEARWRLVRKRQPSPPLYRFRKKYYCFVRSLTLFLAINCLSRACTTRE